MPHIYVEFTRLRQMENSFKRIFSKIEKIKSDFQSTIKQLDWDVKYQSNINDTANRIINNLDSEIHAMKQYQEFLNESYEKYVKLDNISLKMDSTNVSGTGAVISTIGTGILGGFIKSLSEDIEKNKDLLSVAKKLLTGYSKWGNNSEAGVLKAGISYIEDFSKFFSGDKKGLSGASDLCNLADSSIGLWKGGYEYFQKQFDELKTGFFGEVAQKNVKVLGLTGDFLGLIGSITSASDGLNEKSWQTAVADYIDTGKDIISVAKSGYELHHIGDVTGITTEKAGPWSALGIYKAIGDAGIGSIEQGFRSMEKYSSDGKWDVGDTGATGIDISMAGLYGLSHSLTLGLDDVIFGAIDRATGGNGTSDMSYFEKAAEGYKILAKNIGTSIGNWWVNLTT